MEEALRTALRDHEAQALHPAFAVDVISGGRLQPGVGLDDNAALGDLMDQP